MIPKRWEVVMHRLHAKAHEDEVRWTEVAGDASCFAVHFPNHSILISRSYNGVSVRLMDGAAEVDAFSIGKDMTGYSTIENLFLMARRKVYHVEDVLRQLMEALNADSSEV